MKFTSVLVIAVLMAATSVNAQPREVLTLDLTSTQKRVQANTGDGFVVRIDNLNDTGWGWEIGVYRRGSEDNLLYPKGIWHGAFPCQIVAGPNQVFPDERVIQVRSTLKTLTVQLSGVLFEGTEPHYRFTGGLARVLWGSTSNKPIETAAKKPRGLPPR